MNDVIHSYKDLIVWQKSIRLVKEVYLLTNAFPKYELFGLTSQMRRASISIPSNIAEGRFRSTRKDYANFLTHSFASGAELETQIIIAKELSHTKNNDYKIVEELLDEIMRMLNVMLSKLRNN